MRSVTEGVHLPLDPPSPHAHTPPPPPFDFIFSQSPSDPTSSRFPFPQSQPSPLLSGRAPLRAGSFVESCEIMSTATHRRRGLNEVGGVEAKGAAGAAKNLLAGQWAAKQAAASYV